MEKRHLPAFFAPRNRKRDKAYNKKSDPAPFKYKSIVTYRYEDFICFVPAKKVSLRRKSCMPHGISPVPLLFDGPL